MKLVTLLLLFLAGCSNRVNIINNGDEVIITNGAAFRHMWRHDDTYILITNTIPQ